MAVLKLPTVTLCAATSVNVPATVAALSTSLDQAEFAECLLFTDKEICLPDARTRVVPIQRLTSSRAYSDFLLRRLVENLKTPHCLVVQWDGFVINAGRWDPAFLSYDYIGASWPQFCDGFDVGNGGFSLRSRRLLEACLDHRVLVGHPEDVAICRTNRPLLEREHGIRFAGRTMADRFAFERTTPAALTFGFHGIFNMIPALGPERFWDIYKTLDDRSTVAVDYWTLIHQLGGGTRALRRQGKVTLDLLRNRFKLESHAV